jgi:hypothetical protein
MYSIGDCVCVCVCGVYCMLEKTLQKLKTTHFLIKKEQKDETIA